MPDAERSFTVTGNPRTKGNLVSLPSSTLPAEAPHVETSGHGAARLVGATKIYRTGTDEVRALDRVDVEFATGAFTAIMGPSGSGKSTLMHCLGGLDQLTSGAAYIGDVDLTTLAERELTRLRRTKIGFVFQAFNLVPSLSARENIALPLSLSGAAPDPHVFDRVVDMLGIGDRLTHRPSEMSGGQQQRVAVARALVAEPAIVFADEPTGNLDSRTGAEILAFLRAAVDEQQQTTVMVTHDPAAASWADRVVFIVDGRVHHELLDPEAAEVLDIIKSFGR